MKELGEADFDDDRTRNRRAADNLGLAQTIRHPRSQVRKSEQTDKESITMRRSMAGWNIEYLAQVLGISSVSCASALAVTVQSTGIIEP